ncbi:MAG: hypothetical protein MUF42_12755 [Cytophagaceae bacterium]|jgi:hypothetical protein|nr:hypothetical protein [Cytophagaceae bacterium]
MKKLFLIGLLLLINSLFGQIGPGVFLTVNKNTTCSGDQVVFTVYPSGNYEYKLYRVTPSNNLATQTNNNVFYQNPTATATYYVVVDDGATYTSNQVTVTVNNYPSLGTINIFYQSKQTTDGPVDLNAGFVTGAGGTINFFSNDPGVYSNSFYPSTGAQTYHVYYTVTNNGCTSTSSSSIQFDVTGNTPAADFVEALPSYPLPLCQTGDVKYVRIRKTGNTVIKSITIKDIMGSYSAYNNIIFPASTPVLPPPFVNFVDVPVIPERHGAFEIRVSLFYYLWNGSSWVSRYEEGVIPVYPKRIVDVLGLPKKGTRDTVLLCASTNDTLNMRAVPGSGVFGFQKIIGTSTFNMPNGFSNYPVSASDSTFARKFVPFELFRDSSLRDYNTIFKVLYTYPKPGSGVCPTTDTTIIKFNRPQNISYTKVTSSGNQQICLGDTLRFTTSDNSSLLNNKYAWSYGDGFTETLESFNYQNHSYIYKRPGRFTLRFKSQVNTSLSPDSACNADSLAIIIVGAQPKADFEIKGLLENTNSTLYNRTVADLNRDIEKDTIARWTWYYDAPLTTPSSTFNVNVDSVQHLFPLHRVQPYRISLVATTPPHYPMFPYGCKDSITRHIPIFPLDTPQVGSFYFNDFSTPGRGWYQSGDYRIGGNSSWKLQAPAGSVISDPGNTAWVTDNLVPIADSRYNFSEFSWIESPVFYLDSLSRSLLSLRTWVQSESQLDGASIQWAFADTTFGDERWKTIGAKGQGVGWYSSDIVVSMIGKLDTINKKTSGWTGSNSKWVESKIKIDDVVAEAKNRPVRFRVLFSSNADNAPEPFEGFAFDDFSLGYRDRKVLIEEFVTSAALDTVGPNTADKKVATDPQALNIKYFVGYLGKDTVNDLNRADPSARALLYGFSEAQRAVIDGTIFQNKSYSFNSWGNTEFSKQILKTSDFSINPEVGVVNGKLYVNATIARKTGTNALQNRPFLVHIAVLSNHAAIPNVLRKMLPSAAGTFYWSHNWNTNLKLDTNFYVPIQRLSQQKTFKVLVFIQDYKTKEIYQTEQVEYTIPVGYPLLSEYNPEITQGENIRRSDNSIPNAVIFPQPTMQDAQVEFALPLMEHVQYSIRNSMGVELAKGEFKKGEDLFEIYTGALSPGFYSLVLQSSGSSKNLHFIKQ